MTTVPQGEIPFALLTRRCSDGHRLRFVAALTRLHLGLSYTPEFGDGTVILRSSWRAFVRGALRVGESVAKSTKAELVKHGGVRCAGERDQIIRVETGESRARLINRGICRLLVEHLADAADGPRLDSIAVAALVAVDLYLGARHDGETITGQITLADLEARWETDYRTIHLALRRLEVNGLLTRVAGRQRGQGRGSEALRYTLPWPNAWRGRPTKEEAPLSVGTVKAVLSIPNPDLQPGIPPPSALQPGIAPESVASDLELHPSLWVQFQVATVGGVPFPGRMPAQRAQIQGATPSDGCNSASQPDLNTVQPAITTCALAGVGRNYTPQESMGDREEGGQGEGGTSTLPPIPPDHPEQQGIADQWWPRMQSILDGLTAMGHRLEGSPHLAVVLRDLEPAAVWAAAKGCRIEDAWDLRVALYRSGLRRNLDDLWHDDVAAAIADCDYGLARVCTAVDGRREWLQLFARSGLRLAGILALSDALFPRTRVDTEPRFARFHEAATREWVRSHATSAHVLQVRKAIRSVPAPPTATATAPTPTVPGVALPQSARDELYAGALTPDELTTHRLWLYQAENRLIRSPTDELVVCLRSATTAQHLKERGILGKILAAGPAVFPWVVSVRFSPELATASVLQLDSSA